MLKVPVALWNQLNADYKSKVKLSIWAAQDTISAMNLRDCKNAHGYELNIQWSMSNFNLGAKRSSNLIPNS